MTAIRTTLFLALTALTLSCGGAGPGPTPPDPAANKVDVAIASVTLADDCGTPPTEPVAEAEREAKTSAEADSAESSRRICRQSSIQLKVANHTAAPATIALRKVELLDDAGRVLGELQSRSPSQWSADAYQAWDEQLASDQSLAVSYALSRPAATPGGTYIIRITVDAGDGERTLEQRTTLEVEASLPPDVET
jgi:hypothetical protein